VSWPVAFRRPRRRAVGWASVRERPPTPRSIQTRNGGAPATLALVSGADVDDAVAVVAGGFGIADDEFALASAMD
jgi:hypothetical protein